ncbi:oligosaccharide flippase family protein [Cognatishimia sp.]|uniref:oligosaccharide flippase family protein n=1 Tax=Cognatishimia sp. TaxID=2211648 RepID=UPI0035192E36
MQVTTVHKAFLKGLMSYGASEMVAKISRLFVVVVIARVLTPESVGLAAAAFAICETIKALTENGVGQRIIAADDDELEAIAARAHWIFWRWALALIAFQLSLAAVLFALGFPVIAGLVAVAAFEYLFMPGGQVQVALAMREGRHPQVATIAGVQIVSANVLTILMAIVLPSPIVLILPRVLTAPIWLVAVRRLRPWRRDVTAPRAPLAPFIRYGLPVLGVEGVKALRMHTDKLIVGILLGAEGLGLYFMAFNAGLNIATSYASALAKIAFAHLSQSLRLDADARQSGILSLIIIAPMIALQAVLAPIYVPFLLGDGWIDIVPAVSILCLCALPLTLWTVSAARLRLKGQPEIELGVDALLVLMLALAAVVTAPMGLTSMALGYLATMAAVLCLASAPLFLPPAGHPAQEH